MTEEERMKALKDVSQALASVKVQMDYIHSVYENRIKDHFGDSKYFKAFEARLAESMLSTVLSDISLNMMIMEQNQKSIHNLIHNLES